MNHDLKPELKLCLVACLLLAGYRGGSGSEPPSGDAPPPAPTPAKFAKVHEYMVGGFSADQRVAIAPASKMVSGVVMFRLVEQNYLSLTGSNTPWIDREAGYYAIVGMETATTQGEAVNWALALKQQLKPLIVQSGSEPGCKVQGIEGPRGLLRDTSTINPEADLAELLSGYRAHARVACGTLIRSRHFTLVKVSAARLRRRSARLLR